MPSVVVPSITKVGKARVPLTHAALDGIEGAHQDPGCDVSWATISQLIEVARATRNFLDAMRSSVLGGLDPQADPAVRDALIDLYHAMEGKAV
jgi:hypothetical protein